MRRAWIAASALMLVALTACTSPKSSNEPPANPPATTQPTEERPAGFDDFKTALVKIDPKQADRKEKPVLDDVENTCSDIERGEENNIILKHVASRFDVDEAKASKILDALKEHVCK